MRKDAELCIFLRRKFGESKHCLYIYGIRLIDMHLRDIIGSTGMIVIGTVKWYYIFKFLFWYPIKLSVVFIVQIVLLGYKTVYFMLPVMWKMTVGVFKGIWWFTKFIISLF